VFVTLHFRHVVATHEVQRRVTCEKCNHEYRYVLSRSSALDTIPIPNLIKRAEQICRDRVARRLSEGVEPVCCPACGWMQSQMIPELRRRFASGIRTMGSFFALASAALAIVFLLLGIWHDVSPRRFAGVDVDWFGIAGAGAAGCAIGLLMILVRFGFGVIRYRRHGFASELPTKSPGAG
jgi:hypothetical protein